MKSVLAACLLIIALAFPVFAGHTQSGNAYCKCGTVGCIEDYPGECAAIRNETTQQSDSPTDAAEIGILIVALLLWLRLKA
ncbi:MAG TPA: hypothetical protein VF762_23025 [Blastocatellia bacterium]|jgi:hypothetical protein